MKQNNNSQMSNMDAHIEMLTDIMQIMYVGGANFSDIDKAMSTADAIIRYFASGGQEK